MKKLFLCTFITLLLFGCTQTNNSPTAVPTASATTETEQPTSLKDIYPALEGNVAINIADKEETLNLLQHGTGILFLGFPECPWCSPYLVMLNNLLNDNDETAYYYNIYVDKTDDRPYYDQVADLINSSNPNIIAYDNDGKYRIYMPLILFIDNGEIVVYDNETSQEDSSVITPEQYWTEEKKDALQKKLTEAIITIKQKQAENDAKGCDSSSCEYNKQ